MPICKRDGFDNMPSRNRNETFHDNDEVFFCEVTREIFRDYEDYFRHVMVINSTVWQCEATGRDNLTYAEALRSERRARKKLELFKYCLRAPVMLVVENSKQSSLNTLCVILCKFLRKRFFINEEVTACHKTSTYNAYTVLGIVPSSNTPPANGVYEETEKLQYKLRRKGQNEAEVIVPFENIRRQRQEFTTENLQMFVKDNVTRVDGILRPKPESYQKYVTNQSITFENIFIGKMPHFTPAKIKRPSQDTGSKKQSTLNKYFAKDGKTENENNVKNGGKLSEQEEARREKKRAQKAEEEEARLADKLKRIAEQERQKEEKRKLVERVNAECNALLTKTDDLERTDQRLLPLYRPVKTYIPAKLVGDAFMIREFIHSFPTILSGIEVFRGNLSFFEMSRAFSIREVSGPLSDIILILLGTVFDMQKEEEEDCSVEYLRARSELKNREPLITMSEAARAHKYAKRHFSFKINELPIDSMTLSEVLRLHLLSSGAIVKERAEKWRIKYRNGYSSSEDPGLMLRMRYPHILRSLKLYTIYQLPFTDIVRIARCLMAQILTYSSPINLIEERMEQMSTTRMDLRVLTTMENTRLSNVQTQKRNITNEFHQQLMEDEIKSNKEKKKQLEEKLNKKIAELLAQSERERRKYEQQVEGFNSSLFNFLVYLGMDRAYRKYYVLESMPGIFVEHAPDALDTCLSDPPKNVLGGNSIQSNIANLPKNRKDIRAYLLKMYTDEDKEAAKADKAAKTPKNTISLSGSQENKEDKENHLVNGITNGKDVTEGNEPDTKSEEKVIESEAEESPSQYQLYMCTGNPRNCIVHDERNADRQRWTYIYEKEDIDALIAALNPLGERESQLKEQLTTLRQLIVNHCKKCPEELLTLDDNQQVRKFKSLMMSETSRKYSKANFGFGEGGDLNEVMHAALIDRIIQFESDIYTGDLGRLKVKDMEKWRSDLQSNQYDPQVKLQLGPKVAIDGGDDDEGADDDAEDDVEVDAKDGGKYATRPFKDPGDVLGDTIEIDSEDSGDELISLHDSPTIRTNVQNCAYALLQVEQAIERRFIKEPFGAPLKDVKDKEFLERKIKWGLARLKQWEVSLVESTSFSQVFLHLNILHDCILWARSTNKSLCQVCRRGSDPDKMLLCDECNGGTHMFCMKPKMKTVPEGNWYCARCVKRLGIRNENEEKNSKSASQRRKRTFNIDDNIDDGMVNGTKDGERGRSSGRRSSKPLQTNEIEEALEDDNDEAAQDSDEDDNGDSDADENNSENLDDDAEIGSDKGEDIEDDEADKKKSEDGTEQEEDDNVCVVCSYDGSDLMCIRCKETFHLECINMKRAPRYNFICPKCKSVNGSDKSSPRSIKRNSKHILDSSNDDDDDDSEPLVKRTRPSRSSLRNSGYQQQNGHGSPREAAKSASQRRSIRRTGDHLPLNSAALYQLLDDVMKHEDAWPFTRPVSQAEVPDYHKIIKTPMDLAKVKSKLNMGAYQLNEEVMKDIQLIFQNCDEYNVKGNEIYSAGSTLEKYVIEQCKCLNLPFKPSDMNSSQ
ncbi:bromodomain adjacent to zinc finger domain protein 1A [Anastrepha obliqua]|uniref:bromodomain adjacent to zinc finger domain protein 1A n=1 Tax=Anastrepha obliqua TaxID=95512 RepID=UPI0024093293|nr:bromodomain adjacent to zinc finger domain protein 1A [Anastrepha obliqua]